MTKRGADFGIQASEDDVGDALTIIIDEGPNGEPIIDTVLHDRGVRTASEGRAPYGAPYGVDDAEA